MNSRIKNICKLILWGGMILPSFNLYAQKEDIYSQLRKKYSSENEVFVSRKEDATIKIEKDVPVIYSNVSEELMFLSDNNSGYDREVYWSDFSEIKDLDASSMIPDGKKYKTLKIKNFIRSNEISDGAFYDDSRAYKINYPALTNGSRTLLSYTEKINDPHLYGRFFFNTYAPTEDAEYSVTFPSDVKIRYKLFNIKDSSLQFTTKTSGKNTTYTWKIHEAKKIKGEDGAPNFSYYAPNVVVLVEQYTVNGHIVKVLPDPSGLYDWWYGLVKGINTNVSPDVKKVVDSVTYGVTDSLEKAKRIFNWVLDNITYIAYEDSLGGVVPREASLVCSRRFGDCKDMASTLTQMINAAGLHAYQTWIGTRDIPYTFTDVPSPISANHMICTYIQDGKNYFLDATGKDAPFGFFTSMIQGKQCIIGMGEGKFKLATIPEMGMDKNLFTDTTKISLDGTHIKGTGVLHTSGYNKILIGRRIQNMDKKERNDFLIGLLQKGNNKFSVDSLRYENLEDRLKDLGIHYNFSLDDYVQKNGNELYVNLHLAKEYMNDLLEADRQAPREIEYKGIQRNVSVLQIPKGYKVSYLPDSASYNNPNFGFDIHYSVKGNTIVDEKSIYMNTLMVEPKDFANWNKMIKQLTKAYNETVTLVKE
jgi:transglutaminase-like putative cysteine protease